MTRPNVWPETVPVLKPEDFVIGPYRKGDRSCLMGWGHQIFHGTLGWSEVFWDALDELEPDDPNKVRLTSCARTNTLGNRQLAAKVWKRFITKLGYTEPGPVRALRSDA